jgi:tellurium resistance protein TerZ
VAISMDKGQKISLSKEAGKELDKITMGLGWDPAPGERSIDLDASCVLFDEGDQMVDAVWFRQLKSKDGSIQHTGDNLTGAGDGDDEQIKVELGKVPGSVRTLVFCINNYSGQSFAKVANAFCRVIDDKGAEVARYDLSAQGDHNACVVAKLYRHQGEWKMAALGEMSTAGRTFKDLLPVMQTVL